VTIGGGFAKIVKLAQGAMDLHSGRSQVDFEWLARRVSLFDRERVLAANTALEVLEISGEALAQRVASEAKEQVERVLLGAEINAEVMIVDRAGKIIGHAT
jgi:cobalt-precorrin-5B (C1)-methyltransferase